MLKRTLRCVVLCVGDRPDAFSFGVLRMYSLVIKVLAVLFASLCSFSYSISRGLELHCHDLGFVRLAATALFLIFLVNKIENQAASHILCQLLGMFC